MDWKSFENRLECSLESLKDVASGVTTLIVLGSGLFEVARLGEEEKSIPFEDIPYHPKSFVQGHPGKYVISRFGGERVVFSLGRVHLYEGYHPLEVVYGLTLWARLGVKRVILTNASGGIGEYEVGDVVLIEDHINHQGTSPLIGCPLPARFVPMIDVYDQDVITYLQSIGVKTGVYAGVLGPQYETPAEIRSLKILGATLVGMSTVQEAIMAKFLGLKVCGFSLVTNRAAGLGGHIPNHQSVLDIASQGAKRMRELVTKVLEYWKEK
ncbi:purine-nucleoside phosphorylase [Thermospira aquatica]|uniref:Purine nucleoside phosphorylase n=1 Tax=Thermospira aquatica TaxID=2828656 RepID=A0AAX3BBK6_9SPIR|nr:purine-nucleoside phosphorylase [Thermospira aquatica]URA09657.1 purine-nucleoside phosphorylase [Thermospira aquatica]